MSTRGSGDVKSSYVLPVGFFPIFRHHNYTRPIRGDGSSFLLVRRGTVKTVLNERAREARWLGGSGSMPPGPPPGNFFRPSKIAPDAILGQNSCSPRSYSCLCYIGARHLANWSNRRARALTACAAAARLEFHERARLFRLLA